MVEYEFGTNIDTAYINLKKAIDGTKRDMPEDVEDPNILEMDMNASPVTVSYTHLDVYKRQRRQFRFRG